MSLKHHATNSGNPVSIPVDFFVNDVLLPIELSAAGRVTVDYPSGGASNRASEDSNTTIPDVRMNANLKDVTVLARTRRGGDRGLRVVWYELRIGIFFGLQTGGQVPWSVYHAIIVRAKHTWFLAMCQIDHRVRGRPNRSSRAPTLLPESRVRSPGPFRPLLCGSYRQTHSAVRRCWTK